MENELKVEDCGSKDPAIHCRMPVCRSCEGKSVVKENFTTESWVEQFDARFENVFRNEFNEDGALSQEEMDEAKKELKAFIANKIKEAYETGIDEGMYRIAAERILNKQAK